MVEVGDELMEVKPYAYGRFAYGKWTIFCPTCWTNKYGKRQATADLTGSNGDVIPCSVCGTELS